MCQGSRAHQRAYRWRGLWPELHELLFRRVSAHKIRGRARSCRPKISSLDIYVPEYNHSLTGAPISSLLRAADRLAPKKLAVSLYRDYSPLLTTFALSCFASAISIHLDITRLKFTLAPAGQFASLEQLNLVLLHCTVASVSTSRAAHACGSFG